MAAKKVAPTKEKSREMKPSPKKAGKKVVAQRQQNAVTRYFRETQGEVKKVVWPTPREAWNLTVIVGIVILGMAFTLGGFDAIFNQ